MAVNTRQILDYLSTQRDRAFEIQALLTAAQALGPENGGQGEWQKAKIVESILAACNVKNIAYANSPDLRVETGSRPNIIAKIPGRSERTLWLFGHLDVVPAGNGWNTNPWQACRKGDFAYGRGVEDNQQAVTSMLLLAESLDKLGIMPNLALGLVFMADEECGSAHGLEYILKTRPEIFAKDDLYIVPDSGSQSAAIIEIAEKGQLWLKFTVNGKQCHASTPHKGVNALVAASRLIVALNDLGDYFSNCDTLFKPPCSTFAPTRQDGNGVAINIIPANDVFYLDCRLLPSVEPEAVQGHIQTIIDGIAADSGAEISMCVEQCQPATATALSAPVMAELQKAIRMVYGVEGKPCGIGGATVASFLRRAGLPVAVWSCIQNTCHQPNEKSSLTATCKDAAVFASIAMSDSGNA